jgi:hypothetical protein
MELVKFLIEAQQERFKAASAVNAIVEKIKEKVERETFDRYQNKTFFENGIEFELIGVRADFNVFEDDLRIRKIDLRLVFFCKSKLPKKQKERLELAKKRYMEYKFLEWSNHKVPLWQELSYTLDAEKLLSEKINLAFK